MLKKVILILPLLLTLSLATPRPLVQFGFESGGDELVTVDHDYEADYKIDAGDGFRLELGMAISDPLNQIEIQFLAGYKFDSDSADNGSISWSMIPLSALGFISLFLALMLLFIPILGLKIASPKDVHRNIDYNLILIIVMSLALGLAMVKTGVAELISGSIIDVFSSLGPIGILSGVYIVTAILAAYITNKAAVAIIFPVALTLASDLQVNPMPFILVVSFASAANFITPIGYQTNLMIYGPGSYRFKDFFKIGFPLTIIYMIVTILILNYMYF